jgi:site-specific recombinase XerD
VTLATVPAPARARDVMRLLDLVLDRLNAPTSKAMYRRALLDFLDWYQAQPAATFDRAAVQRYRAMLLEAGRAPSTINQKLSAIRALASEAADNGLLDPQLASGVAKVKGVPSAGTRTGNWLTQAQAQHLLDAPDVGTRKGVRDRAMLAVLLGCGLRRSEIAALTLAHVQQRDGRWVIVDLVGKHHRVRSVPMPSWTKVAIDAWTSRAGVDTGRVFRSLRKGNHGAVGAGLSTQAIANVVAAYAGPLGLTVAPHDCRRTFAKLALKGGARLEQIQLSLGHASIRTTERYLGVEQDLTDAPCDRLGLRLQGV